MDSNKLFLVILGIISGILIINKTKKLSATIILVTIIIGYSITNDFVVASSLGLILGNIIVSLNNVPSIKIPPLPEILAELNIPEEEVTIEGFKSNKKKKKKKRRKKKEKFSTQNDEFIDKIKENYANDNSDDENEDEFFLDNKGSFYENYKSLTPKQVKGLNKDTKNLIDTQKQLIETLKNMGPALKDGKQILDTFKNYFGNEQDMNKMLSNFKV